MEAGELAAVLIPGRPRIAVTAAGRGELILMLHGVGGNRRNWASQITSLSQSYLAVAWDARGYGDSDDYEGEFAFSDVAADLLRVIDHFGKRRAHLIGLSMGGNIALDFAMRFPDRVHTLVLADTDTGMGHLSKEERAQFLALRSKPVLGGVPLEQIAPPIVESLVSKSASEAARLELTDSILRLHRRSYVKAVKAVLDFTLPGRLDRIVAPTLLVVGEEDTLTPPALSEEMCGEISNSELVLIERAGHLSNVEQPAQFNRVVAEFLARHAGKG